MIHVRNVDLGAKIKEVIQQLPPKQNDRPDFQMSDHRWGNRIVCVKKDVFCPINISVVRCVKRGRALHRVHQAKTLSIQTHTVQCTYGLLHPTPVIKPKVPPRAG